MLTAEQDALAPLRAWLLQIHPQLDQIDDELDLFANKLIDSLNFVEYVLMIEEISGQAVHVDNRILERLSTLARVRRHFLA
jgi:acyl carrier protein